MSLTLRRSRALLAARRSFSRASRSSGVSLSSIGEFSSELGGAASKCCIWVGVVCDNKAWVDTRICCGVLSPGFGLDIVKLKREILE